MSAPKQIAKRLKVERKRRRKLEATRRRERRQQAGLAPFDVLGPAQVVYGPVGGVKMSEVLERFLEPWEELAEDMDAYSKLMSLGVVAWNVALEPEDQRSALIGSMIAAAMKGASLVERLECRELIDTLVARKLRHFAAYRRPIVGYQLHELEDGGWYLSVASAVC